MVAKTRTSGPFNAIARTALLCFMASLLVPILSGLAHAASLENIRFGQHGGYIRVVLDTDAAITHEIEEESGVLSVRVFGLVADDLSQNMPDHITPLQEIVLRNGDDGTVWVGFQSTAPFAIKAFHLPPAKNAHHRLVIDLHVAQPVSIERRETAKAKRVKLRFNAARRGE